MDTALCTDGATDEEHLACVEYFGECPYCGSRELIAVSEPDFWAYHAYIAELAKYRLSVQP